jgi:hypothetical protein
MAKLDPWIKVKTVHVLDEYNDLTDKEFRAWIKLMALTCRLEHIPTNQQMTDKVHYKTIESLNDTLMTHQTTLNDILNEVLKDVQGMLENRERQKQKQKEYRARLTPVTNNVTVTLRDREEKRREEKNIKKEHIAVSVPDWIKKETWDAFLEMRKSIGAKPTNRAIELLISKLNHFRLAGQDPNAILDQSTMNNWKGVFAIKQEVQNNAGIRTSRSDPSDKNLQSRTDAECDAITARWYAAKKAAGSDPGGDAGHNNAPNI